MADSPETKSSNGNGRDIQAVSFHYIKSALFRTIHTDGIIGGLNPNGFLSFALWNERAAIPRKLTHKVNPDGTLGEIIEKEARIGVVREMDVEVVMSVPTAKALKEWLEQKIAEAVERENK